MLHRQRIAAARFRSSRVPTTALRGSRRRFDVDARGRGQSRY